MSDANDEVAELGARAEPIVVGPAVGLERLSSLAFMDKRLRGRGLALLEIDREGERPLPFLGPVYPLESAILVEVLVDQVHALREVAARVLAANLVDQAGLVVLRVEVVGLPDEAGRVVPGGLEGVGRIGLEVAYLWMLVLVDIVDDVVFDYFL